MCAQRLPSTRLAVRCPLLGAPGAARWTVCQSGSRVPASGWLLRASTARAQPHHLPSTSPYRYRYSPTPPYTQSGTGVGTGTVVLPVLLYMSTLWPVPARLYNAGSVPVPSWDRLGGQSWGSIVDPSSTALRVRPVLSHVGQLPTLSLPTAPVSCWSV